MRQLDGEGQQNGRARVKVLLRPGVNACIARQGGTRGADAAIPVVMVVSRALCGLELGYWLQRYDGAYACSTTAYQAGSAVCGKGGGYGLSRQGRCVMKSRVEQ